MSLFELRSDTPALPTTPLGSAIRARAADGTGAGGGTPWWTLALVAVLAAVGLAVVGGRVLVNGDGVWHLIWGRALIDGSLETFALGPTPHPSLLVLAAATSTLGDEASYLITYVAVRAAGLRRSRSGRVRGRAPALVASRRSRRRSDPRDERRRARGRERRAVRHRVRRARDDGRRAGDGAPAPRRRAARLPRGRRARAARGVVPRGRVLVLAGPPALVARAVPHWPRSPRSRRSSGRRWTHS